MSDVSRLKWDETNTNRAVELYADGNDPKVIATALSSDTVECSHRQVISKLTQLGKYVAPVKPAKAPREPVLTKNDIAGAFAENGFTLESLSRANVEDLVRLAEHVGVTLPQPK